MTGTWALLHRAGLNVVEAGEDESWYGFGTTQIRVEHPWLAGRMLPSPASAPKAVEHVPARPAPPSRRRLAESSYEARLRRAGPALLALARERAAELAAAISLVPCAGSVAVGACVSCELRAELARITAVIAEVEVP